MAPATPGNSTETNRLLERVAAGEQEVWGELLMRHQERLRCMVAVRLDRRLQGRIDPSDVLQEAYLQASLQLAEYLKKPTLPFFLWLRLVTGQRLATLHRYHLGTQGRDAGREVSLYRPSTGWTRSTARCSCCAILNSWTTPRPPRSWSCASLRPANGTSAPCSGSKRSYKTCRGAWRRCDHEPDAVGTGPI